MKKRNPPEMSRIAAACGLKRDIGSSLSRYRKRQPSVLRPPTDLDVSLPLRFGGPTPRGREGRTVECGLLPPPDGCGTGGLPKSSGRGSTVFLRLTMGRYSTLPARAAR